MLYYNRIDFSKYVDIDKTSASKDAFITIFLKQMV